MTAPELAYRHPKRGKAHRWDRRSNWVDGPIAACGRHIGLAWKRVPVDSLDPADLCKRCWPERAK